MNNEFRFTVATATSLYAKLSAFQRQVIDIVWRNFISSDQPYSRIQLVTAIDRNLLENRLVDDHLMPLRDHQLLDITDNPQGNDSNIQLTIYGVLITPDGPHIASLLVKLLTSVKQQFSKNSAIQTYSSDDFVQWAKFTSTPLSSNDVKLLQRLLTLRYPPNMPFHFSSSNPSGTHWEIRRTKNVEQLHFAENISSYLDELLNDGFSAFGRLNPLSVPEDDELAPPALSPDQSATDSGFASSRLSSTRTESEAVSDILGREKLTEALHRLITTRQDDNPFAIGLFGHWGTGKTSQINFLKKELKKTENPQFFIADFNAWQNEKATNLAAMLAQAVVEGLTARKPIRQKLWLAIQLAAMRHLHAAKIIKANWWSRPVSYALVFLPYASLFAAVAAPIYFLVPPDLPAKTFATTGGVGSLFLSGYHFMRSHLTEWFKRVDVKKAISLFHLPDYSSHRGLALEIHRTLKDLCSLCLNPKEGSDPADGAYLLLVIDDLDRCGVETVKEVFDAIRLVANIPRVITLLAIDERIAYAAVGKHYVQFEYPGRPSYLVARDHLAKVLQVCVTLPEVDNGRIATYVRKMFAESPDALSQQWKVDTITPKEITPQVNDLPRTTSEEQPMAQPVTIGAGLQDGEKQSSLPQEHALFEELAQTYAFSNPRLLGRIHLAWKLLKSLHLGPEYAFSEVEILMHLLFWREWLHQLPHEQRHSFSSWFASTASQALPEGMPPNIGATVNRTLRMNWNKNSLPTRVVDAVLLPPSPILNSVEPRKGSNLLPHSF